MRIIGIFCVMFLSFFIYSIGLASFSISPLKYEFTIEKSTSKKEKIKITNNDNTPITLYTSREDFISGDENGTPKFINPEEQISGNFSLSNWIEIEDKNITLAPNESKEVVFEIKVPANAEPGGHYAGIFFSPGTPSGAQVAVVQRLGVLVLINVPGEVKIEGNLKNFDIGTKKENSTFESKNAFSTLPIIFETLFENIGNVHLKPTGKIILTDEKGEVLKNIGKETLSSPAGAYIGEKMVDYLPINDTLGNVLPQSQRKFQTIWEGFGYHILNEDGTKSVKFKNITDYYADKAGEKAQYLMFWEQVKSKQVTKKITAEYELSYEAKDLVKKTFTDKKDFSVTYDEKYIGLNFTVIIFFSLLVLFGIYYILIIHPKQKAQKEDELKRKIIEEMKKNQE